MGLLFKLIVFFQTNFAGILCFVRRARFMKFVNVCFRAISLRFVMDSVIKMQI